MRSILQHELKTIVQVPGNYTQVYSTSYSVYTVCTCFVQCIPATYSVYLTNNTTPGGIPVHRVHSIASYRVVTSSLALTTRHIIRFRVTVEVQEVKLYFNTIL